MSGPAFLVDNFFSATQYPSATVAGEEEATGHEAWRVADGRRSALDYWTPTTANSSTYVGVDLGSAKAATMVALDRGHNLAGLAGVTVQYSSDNFASDTHDAATVTIPASSSDDTSLDATNGCTTPEGAWLKRFNSASARYWRFTIPAMGAGLAPQIVGLWLGVSWEPNGIAFPFAEDDATPMAEATQTPWGWEGSGIVTRRRSGSFLVRVSGTDYATAATHLRDNWLRRRPMWIVPEDARAERAVLADCALGATQAFPFTASQRREITLPWLEREPLVGG
jgi:hypothetical protein